MMTILSIVMEMNIIDINNYSLIKVKLDDKSAIDFYSDDSMRQENTFYTFNNIPPNYICWSKSFFEIFTNKK